MKLDFRLHHDEELDEEQRGNDGQRHQIEGAENLEHQLLSSITDLTEGFGQSMEKDWKQGSYKDFKGYSWK